MAMISPSDMLLAKKRVYVFTALGSLLGFLSFWTIGQLVIVPPLAAVGAGAYVFLLLGNAAIVKWLSGHELPPEDGTGNGDSLRAIRFGLGNAVVLASAVLGSANMRATIEGQSLPVLPWQLAVGCLLFVLAWAAGIFLTFIKREEVGALAGDPFARLAWPKTPPPSDKKASSEPLGRAQAPAASKELPVLETPPPVPVPGTEAAPLPAASIAPAVEAVPVPSPVVTPVGQSLPKASLRESTEPSVMMPRTKTVLQTTAPTPMPGAPFQAAGGRVFPGTVFDELGVDQQAQRRALDVLRRAPEHVHFFPPKELYEKKGKAFFQQAVIRALGDSRDPAAVPFLGALLGSTYDLAHGREDFHRPQWPHIGVDAASALARIETGAAAVFLQALQSTERLRRLYGVYGIALLRDRELRPALAQAAASEQDPVVAIYLARAMAQLERKEFVSAAAIDLIVTVEPALLRLRVGEPVRCFWNIRNGGSEAVTINAHLAQNVRSIFHVKPLHDPLSGLPPFDSDSSPGGRDLIVLPPGASHRAGPFDLREGFDLAKPGSYEVVGVYQNRFPGIEYGVYAIEGRLASKPVIIEISLF